MAAALTLAMVLSITACSSKAADTGSPAATTETTSAESVEELTERANALFAQENEILDTNNELWNRVFAFADKETLSANKDAAYADLLTILINSGKDTFTEDELATLTADVESIRKIEDEITEIQNKIIDLGSVVTETTVSANNSTFPAFSGNDLDGNAVDSSLFSQNAVTVVNFWYNGCSPCVAELSKLNELNETLKEMGGEVIGINTGTLDGNESEITDAKALLANKGALYRNVYFDSDSEAGKFATDIMTFPTTILVDRNGNIVGEPLLGGIDNQSNYDKLMEQINSIIAADK